MEAIVLAMLVIGTALIAGSGSYFWRWKRTPVTRTPGKAEIFYGRGLYLGIPGLVLTIANAINIVVYIFWQTIS